MVGLSVLLILRGPRGSVQFPGQTFAIFQGFGGDVLACRVETAHFWIRESSPEPSTEALNLLEPRVRASAETSKLRRPETINPKPAKRSSGKTRARPHTLSPI